MYYNCDLYEDKQYGFFNYFSEHFHLFRSSFSLHCLRVFVYGSLKMAATLLFSNKNTSLRALQVSMLGKKNLHSKNTFYLLTMTKAL